MPNSTAKYAWGYLSEEAKELTLVLGGFDKQGHFKKKAAIQCANSREWCWKIAGTHLLGVEACREKAMRRVECILDDVDIERTYEK